jgi:DNA-binding NtrC family response regulator
MNRLAVVPIDVPPLAERREDIPLLVQTFMRQISEHTGIRPKFVGDDAMAVLQTHDWPGNIRQLRNNIERLMILTRDDRRKRSSVWTCYPRRSAKTCRARRPRTMRTSWRCRCAMRASVSSAIICWRRSRASAETSRVRRNSLVWSDPLCTAS